MVYDVTEPASASFVTYTSNRDVAVSIKDIEEGVLDAGAAGDLGPESVLFIPAAQTPGGKAPLLVVGNEISGTTTIYRVEQVPEPE
ncbi:hypothetical protein C1141_21810 [Vibrio agarivorans]|nr:hypothetical protein C1141_21810 [Vibrio agarivorans]